MREYDYEYAEHFYLTKPSFKGIEGIWPWRAGKTIAKDNYHVGPKFIDGYSFHFVMEGKVVFSYRGKEVELQEGDMFCLFPDIVYEYSVLSFDRQLTMIWIVFSETQIYEIIRALQLNLNKSYVRISDHYTLFNVLNRIVSVLKVFEENKLEHTLQLQQLIYELMHLLLIHHNENPHLPIADWLEQGKDYIDRHFTEGITIENIASHIGVHRSYFSDCFSKKYGIAPIRYLQKRRLEKGKEMLRLTNHTVTEIALSLGYPNLYAFTRAFTQYCNLPPTRYRSLVKTVGYVF